MKHFVLATRNPNKLVEVRAALHGLKDWEVLIQAADLPEVEETGSTFLENATLKAVQGSQHTASLVVGDDSGICVDALGGRPGIHSARYAENAEARIRRLLGEMESVPAERRQAHFACALVLAQKGQVIWTTEVHVHGMVARTPLGDNGFGYDPVFWLPEFGCTVAQLEIEQKNRMSHRGQAVMRLAEFLSAL